MVGDGGGVQNFSPSVGTVAVTAAQSVYYFPESDLSTQVNPSIGVTSGSMRGYGTVQSMAYIEMLVDEIAQEIGLDPIELRQRNVLKSGMKNTQGASPAGHLRIGEILELAAKEPLWVERAKRKAEYEAANPGMLYGMGFGASQKDFGTGAEACIAQIEISPEGRLKMRHIANEIGTGSTTSQLVTVESILEMAVSTGTGKVQLLSHKTWLECGTPIVPELISGQMQGGVVMGIGHALYEDLPRDATGPGNGQWGLSRYHVPRASEVAVWKSEGHVLPPLSRTDPPKGMAEVVMIPVVAACVHAIAAATGKRFYATPVTPEKIKEVM